MEIKKLNPDDMSAPLVGGVVERSAVKSSNTDNLTMDDEAEEDEDESTDGAEAEGGEPDSNSLAGEVELNEEDENN